MIFFKISVPYLLIVLLSVQSVLAQPIIKQWYARLGSSDHDMLAALKQTSDGGYILGGNSSSGISGDKTQASQGGQDYWVVKVTSTGTKEWDLTLGGSGTETLTSLQQTSDGGYIIGGYSDSGISGDRTQNTRGLEDYWVIKIDSVGIKEWDVRFGGNSVDQLMSLQQTSDGGYILGGYSWSGANGDRTQSYQGTSDLADYWVVKIDSSGIKEWDVRFGGNSSDHLRSLQQTADGGYILGGESISTISGDKSQGSKGGYDYWVVKIDSLGVKEWDVVLGGGGDDFLYALQQSTDGGYILGGISVSGIGGDKTQAGRGMYDYWVVKVNDSGTKEWDARFGGSNQDYFSALHQTTDGGYILGGYSNSGADGDKTINSEGQYDYWVVKIKSTGEKQWDAGFGGGNTDRLFAVQQTADEGYILGGYGIPNTGGAWDYWIVKIRDEASLPVNLVQFSAEYENGVGKVKWQTAQEQNTKYYQIERSKDMKVFEPISKIAAAGTSMERRSYTYTDEVPLRGRSYYRLRQVDKDRQETVFKAVSIRTSGTDAPYPNPILSSSAIRIEATDSVELLLTDLTGRRISFASRRVDNEVVEIQPTQPLKTGIYLIVKEGSGYRVIVE